MRLPSFTAEQNRLVLPEAERLRATHWVRQQQARAHLSVDDAPFRRVIDFWFTSIAWAVHKDIGPVEQPSGKMFVTIGPNPNDIREFPDWWAKALTILAVDKFGYEDRSCRDVKAIIRLANCYAEPGSTSLLDNLDARADMGTARLYRVADLLVGETETTRGLFEGRSF